LFILCSNERDIADECPTIRVCRGYLQLHKTYIKRIYYGNPSVLKFHKLLTFSDKLRPNL